MRSDNHSYKWESCCRPVILAGEKAVEKAITALADIIPLESVQPPYSPTLIFPGLEIRLHQRRVLKDGSDISLTRLEYGALCCLAASSGRVFTKTQIFEAVLLNR